MTDSRNCFVFTDCDLDGAGSYMALSWLLGKQMKYTSVRVNDFDSIFKGFVDSGKLDKYDMIYILDLDVSQSEYLNLVDNKKITIIDHHQTHVENADKYNHATTHISRESSTARMVYNLFKDNKKLTLPQKTLIAMVDDYDSYKLKVPESYHLNLIYWNYQGNRVEKFLIDFNSGFTEFTSDQKNIIEFYIRKLNNIKKELDVHYATIPIGDVSYKFISVFASECINEVADHIIKNYKSDVGLVINTNSNKVSLRKRKGCELSLGKLASKLFDQGGGHDDAAGGVLCDNFLKFSSLFKPMTIKIGA